MQNAKQVDFKEAFNFGWELVKEKWQFLLGVWAASMVYSILFTVIDLLGERYFSVINSTGELVSSQTTGEMIFYFIYFLFYISIGIVLSFNTLKIYLNIVNKVDVKITDMFAFPTVETVRYVGAGFIYFIMVIVGLLCFIVPGIYFAVKYMYVFNFIAEKSMTIGEAAKASANITTGNIWSLIGFNFMMALACIGILILGLLALVVGIIPAAFISQWITAFAGLSVYKKLQA